METTSRPLQESAILSQKNGGCSIGSSSGNCSSSLLPQQHHHQIPTQPLTPKAISRSEATPYPTTFVQADTSTFKQVVQMLTGSSETAKIASNPTVSDPPPPPPPPATANNKGSFCIPPKRQGFKALYERRNSLKNGLMISPLIPAAFIANGASNSPRKPEILSPSILDFPSLALSPVTPLHEDPFNKCSPSTMGNSSEEEEKAIAEKKFYLHPSPRTTTPRDSQPPQLLPLFPVTSPRVSGSSS